MALGLIVGASIASETASAMFSAQALVGHAPELAAFAGIGATAFALVQGFVRIREAIGCALQSATSALCACRSPRRPPVCSLSFYRLVCRLRCRFALVGLGTACIVPSGFAMAAATSARPAAAIISLLSIISGLVRIPTPLAYGWLAERLSYSSAFLVFAFITGAALTLSIAIGSRSRLRSAT